MNTNLRCSLESDVLFNMLLNDHMMLTNLWNQDLVIKKEKMDASSCKKTNESTKKFMDVNKELLSMSRSIIGMISPRNRIKDKFVAAAEAGSSHCLEEID
ncbi:hypothetical protein FF1_030165 [Malus domestica]